MLDSGHGPLRPDHQRRNKRVHARAGAGIEHALSGLEAAENPMVCNTRERLGDEVRHLRQLVRVPEILCPSTACREDEVLLRLL